MKETVMVLERVTRVAPLGLRFWDAVTGRAVTDGLSVTVYPADRPGRRSSGFVNPGSVTVFRSLPGLREAEFGAGDEAFWASPPATRPFVIEVVDNAGRFLPFTVAANLPARGLLAPDCDLITSPPEQPANAVPLFSAPTRPVSAGIAVVRADLWDATTDRPSAWAMLEGQLSDGRLLRGMADGQGRVAILFPYPEPLHLGGFSPPGPRRALAEQAWPLEMRVRYAATLASLPIPDLCQALAQPLGMLWFSVSPPQVLGTQMLAFGKELIIKSTSESILFVTAAGSPPS